MPSLYVDAVVLACPCKPGQQAEFESYLSRVIELAGLHNMKSVRALISSTAIESLMAAEAYPMWDNLGPVSYAQRADVLKIVYSILEKLPKAEDFVGVREILVDTVVCSPDDHLISRLAPFLDQHHRLLALISLDRSSPTGKGSQLLLTLTTGQQVFEMTARGSIADVEFLNPARTVVTPLGFEESLMCCGSVGTVSLAIDPIELWLEGSDYEGAIAASADQLAETSHISPPKNSAWSLGPQFVPTALAAGFSTRTMVSSLLRTCADTVLGLRLDKAHELRTGKGGDNPQIVRRDGSGAMRRRIDDEYRLHYWVTATGVELAAVGVHNSYVIPG